ncbi:MAG: RNA polymerase sigma-70 factor [Bacteroidota bacterium]
MPFTAYTDQELLESIRLGDEKAFAALFKRYWRVAHAMTYSRVRSKEVTQEIVQDLFIALWKRRETLGIKDVRSYLFISIKNRILNYIESQLAKDVRRREYLYQRADSEETTERAIVFNDLMDIIDRAVNLLPEKSSKVFKLSFFEGRSVPEIAETLNVSEKTIEYHLTRSFRKLRVYLKNYILSILAFLQLLLP